MRKVPRAAVAPKKARRADHVMCIRVDETAHEQLESTARTVSADVGLTVKPGHVARLMIEDALASGWSYAAAVKRRQRAAGGAT